MLSEATRSVPICVDANLVVLRVASTNDATTAESVRTLWRGWAEQRRRLVAPRLLLYEVTNALHRLAIVRSIPREDAIDALSLAQRLPIEFFHDVDLHQSAMQLAARFGRPAAYDAHYLALADRLGAEFWTADRRLANSVRHELEWVRLVDD